MRNVRKALLGLTASFALSAAGVVGVTAGPAAAYTGPSFSDMWMLCKNVNLDDCGHYGYNPVEAWGMNYYDNSISSIQTNYYPIHTWNDPLFKGTYGFFERQYRWDQLNHPYGDKISSFKVGY
ncbi:hypothetical protein ACWCPM_11025 [Streptomyces sp. NPDC002309]